MCLQAWLTRLTFLLPPFAAALLGKYLQTMANKSLLLTFQETDPVLFHFAHTTARLPRGFYSRSSVRLTLNLLSISCLATSATRKLYLQLKPSIYRSDEALSGTLVSPNCPPLTTATVQHKGAVHCSSCAPPFRYTTSDLQN